MRACSVRLLAEDVFDGINVDAKRVKLQFWFSYNLRKGKQDNVFLSWHQASGEHGHDVHLHWDSNCCGLCVGECPRGAGCVYEPDSSQHHLLFHRVASCGWHRCRGFGYPSGDYHQSGFQHSVLHMPPPFLPATDHHAVLHPFLAGHCHWPIPTSQGSY